VLAWNQRFRELWSVPGSFDMAGDDQPLIAHLVGQLLHPAPFLYSRAMEVVDGEDHRDLLRLKDGRYIEQITRSVTLGTEHARLWSFRDITERKQIEQRERSHRHVLELLARGAPAARRWRRSWTPSCSGSRQAIRACCAPSTCLTTRGA
jgi:hypothetical protein